jgi:hypothetical protein
VHVNIAETFVSARGKKYGRDEQGGGWTDLLILMAWLSVGTSARSKYSSLNTSSVNNAKILCVKTSMMA